ncbi:MAG: rhomboid family intramembrane serine protease [Deltaproteobacteria bacterium]|nr:rhomboid family intramembrane serine protease [Deltaproteobacteria bacterium]
MGDDTKSETALPPAAGAPPPEIRPQSAPLLLLRRPPFWTMGMTAFLAGAAVVWAAVLFSELSNPRADWAAPRLLLLGALLLAPLLIAIPYRLLTRPRMLPAVVFHPQYAMLPRSADSTRVIPVAYRDILSIDLRGRSQRGHLFVGTPRHLFVYPVQAFEEEDAIAFFVREVRRRIADLPDGPELLGQMARRARISHEALRRKPLVTVAMVLVILVVYALQQALVGPDRLFGLVLVGANAPSLVASGQWYRLASANFLHAGFLHLYMNALALLVLGLLLERLMGHARFLLLFLVSALGGAVASALAAQAAYSVGASTAMFGLLGALAVVNLRFRGELPGGFRQSPQWWLLILGINAALPLLVPQIDVAAHLGGFGAGALVTLALYRSTRVLQLAARSSWPARVAAAALALLFAVGLATSLQRAARGDRGDELLVATAVVESPRTSAGALYALAWSYITSLDASEEQLALAVQATEKAIAIDPDNGALWDGMATARYRLGEFDAAIAAQRQAIARADTRFHALQMARFLRARESDRGALILGDADGGAVTVELETRAQAEGAPRAFVVRLAQPFELGFTLFAHAMRGDRELGLFRASFGPTLDRDFRLMPEDRSFFERWPDDVRLEIGLLDTTGSDGCSAGRWQWRFWAEEGGDPGSR